MGDSAAAQRARRRRVAFAAVVAVVLLASAYRYAEKVRKPARNHTQTKSAILRWRDQIRRTRPSGEDIYAKYKYPNPPIQALILYAAGRTRPACRGRSLWFALKVLMAGRLDSSGPSGWCAATGRRPAGRREGCSPWSSPPHSVLGDLSHGNVNIFIAFLVFAALELQPPRGCPFAGGLTLALAVACKVTPALFLPYFVWKRAWRVMLAGAVASGACCGCPGGRPAWPSAGGTTPTCWRAGTTRW